MGPPPCRKPLHWQSARRKVPARSGSSRFAVTILLSSGVERRRESAPVKRPRLARSHSPPVGGRVRTATGAGPGVGRTTRVDGSRVDTLRAHGRAASCRGRGGSHRVDRRGRRQQHGRAARTPARVAARTHRSRPGGRRMVGDDVSPERNGRATGSPPSVSTWCATSRIWLVRGLPYPTRRGSSPPHEARTG